MKSDNSLKILFDSSVFDIPLKFDLLDNISQDISRSLIYNSKHEYTVKSKVRKEVFTSFLDYLIQDTPPNIHIHDIDEYILLNQEFQFMKLDQLIKNKEEEFKEDLQYFICIKDQNHTDQSTYEEQIALRLDDYLEKYGVSIMQLPITSLNNIFNHHNRKLEDHNQAYELIKIHYANTNDSNIFTLLPSLDGMKLSKENLNDSISSKKCHFGFIPTIEANFLLNAVEMQEKQGRKIAELEETISKQQETYNDFKGQITSVIGKLTETIDELKKTTETQKKTIDDLQMKIESQSETIDELKKKVKCQSETIDNLNTAQSKQASAISLVEDSYSKEIDSVRSEIQTRLNGFFFVEPDLKSPGILERLKEREKNHFDRLFVASQSSGDVYNLIDPNTKDRFGTTNKGNFYINFELKKPITINGIKIFNSNRSFPKSFDIEVEGQIVKSIKSADELNGKYKEMTINFMPKNAKSVKFIQKGQNWDENSHFLEFKRIELLSSDPKYSKGVFATLVGENCDPHKSEVHITSSCFDFNFFYLLDSNDNTCTFDYDDSWFQIEFLSGLAVLYGFRLERASYGKLKDYKIIGTNDAKNPVETWPVLMKINEKTQNDHKLLDVYKFEQPSLPVKFIRIVQTGKNWSEEKNLQICHIDFFGFYI